MSKSKQLINDTIIYAIASFGTKFVSFLLLPLYTGYFTSQEYGKWDLITTTISLMMPFISFEILSAVYRWLLEESNVEKQKEIISTGFLYTIKNMSIFTFIFIIAIKLMHIPNGILMLAMINLSICSDFIQKCVRGCGYSKIFAMIGIAQTIINIITNLILIFLFKIRIETFFISSILSSITAIIIGWITLKFHKYISIEKYSKLLEKDFIKYSFPMIPGAINWWIMNVSDRYIISSVLGMSANGIYAVSNKMPAIVDMMTKIFNLAWQDNAIKGYKDTDRDLYYSNIFKYYLRFMITATTILIATNRIIMGILIDSSFGEAWKYTGILYIGAVFSAFSSFWGAGYHGSKQTSIILNTTMIGAGTNIIVNILLVKQIGLYAASISTIMGYIIMWLSRVFNKNKPFIIKVEIKDFIILTVFMVVVLCFSLIGDYKIDIITILSSIIIFGVYNKDIILKLFGKLQSKVSKKQGIY